MAIIEQIDASPATEITKETTETSLVNYTWKQTLQDVDISLSVPKGTKAKQLDIKITPKGLFVSIKGASVPLMDGVLSMACKVDDSTWMVDSSGELVVHLEKVNKMEWWKCVLVGDPEIDTTKIEPENSKLGDLDVL